MSDASFASDGMIGRTMEPPACAGIANIPEANPSNAPSIATSLSVVPIGNAPKRSTKRFRTYKEGRQARGVSTGDSTSSGEMMSSHSGHIQQVCNLNPKDYEVVWIAPLEIEAQAALHLLDERHRGKFPVSRGDDYVFHAGSMCGHNIVIATLPAGQEYGTGSAAALASQVKKIFPDLWFGLLVGVAAGLPNPFLSPPRDIRLGDVLTDFQPLRFGHTLATTETIVRSAIGSIKSEAPNEARMFLPYYDMIRDKEHAAGTFADPGQDHDRLYLVQNDGTEKLMERARREPNRSRVWYGPIGSGDKLLKNAEKKNELRDRYGVIGLEMEAAGIMNRIPVGVIRGVCDYGDKHKNKEWQPYAAAMAAAYAKAVLNEIPPARTVDCASTQAVPLAPHLATLEDVGVPKVGGFDKTAHRPCYFIQLPKNPRFTGRTAVLDTLKEHFFAQTQSRKAALVGLGGIGKTQLALQFVYWVKENQPEYSIFWVPILSDRSAEQAYIEIAKKLGLQKTRDKDDIKELVCQHLSSEESGKWLLVVDNADDRELVFGSADETGIEDYLPESEKGLILLTTRSRQVAVEFAQSDVIDIEQMDSEEASQFLKKLLIQKQALKDQALITELLSHLTYLPLAIAQAAAYLNQTKMPVHKYLGLLRGAEKDAVRVLGKEFRDSTRYRSSQNAVATTWLVSFDEIQKSDQTAVDLLSFMSCIEPRAIPQSILPIAESEDLEWAIGTLCGYSFLVRRADSDTFDMHSLVHMATRGWVEKQGRWERVENEAIDRLTKVFMSIKIANRELWRPYLPHALRLLHHSNECRTEGRFYLFRRVAICLNEDRQFKDAVKCLEKVCQWRRDRLPEDDDSRLQSEHELAAVYLNDRRIKDAIKVFEYVVAIRKETLDEKDHSRLRSEHELARAYLNDRRIKEAIEIFEHVVAVQKEILHEKNHARLTSENELARAYFDDKRIKEAIEMFEYIVAVRKETLKERDHSRLLSEHGLASAYLSDKRIKEAIKMFEYIVAVRKETLDERDHARLASEYELARAYYSDKRIKEATEILEHVVAVQKETLDEKDYARLTSEHALARAYLDDKRIKEAIEIFEHIVAVDEKTLDEQDHARLASKYKLARAYYDDKRIKEAIEIFEHIVAVDEKTLDEQDHARLTSEHDLARAYLRDGQVQKVVDLLQHVVKVEGRLSAEDHPDRSVSLNLLQYAYEKLESENGTWETGSDVTKQNTANE